MPTIDANDATKIFFYDWGRGKPVVLIHGWPFNADMWEYQATWLAEHGFRVISYDRRGFGRSSHPFTGYTFDTLADDLATILEGLDLHDVSLVGFAMGAGEVARYMARNAGRRVSSAVLISAVTPFLLKTADNPQGIDRSVFDQMVAALRTDRPHFLESFTRKIFGPEASSAIRDWSKNLALQAAPKATLECLRAFSETDFRPDMAAFTIPTLVIHGDADSIVPPDTSARITAEMIPGARLSLYAGAPHALFFTEQHRLNEELAAFLDRPPALLRP